MKNLLPICMMAVLLGCASEEECVEYVHIEEEEVVAEAIREPVLDIEQRDCLALNIYFESRDQSLVGRIAVADVVLNRVADDYYPDTICEVVTQAIVRKNWKGNILPVRNQCQFSWYCDGLRDEPQDPRAWLQAVSIATDMMQYGDFRGITEGSTHYHATYVEPNWVNDRGMAYIGMIGDHEFYRWHR